MRQALAANVRLASHARLLLPLAALAYAIAVVLMVADTPAGTSYHAQSGIAVAADLAAGLALLAVGVVALWVRARSQAGTLAALAGVAWFAPDWEAWVTGPAVVRSLGMLAAPFALALLFHLVLGFPRARVSGAARWAVAAVYSGGVGVGVGRALVSDPFLDPECWRNCTDNAFLLHSDPSLARTLEGLEGVLVLTAGAVMAGVAAARLSSGNGPTRRVLGPVVLPGLLVGVSAAAYAALLLFGPPEDPGDASFASVFLAGSAAVLALALGLGWSVAQARRVRSDVVGLAADLGAAPPPGSLRDVLAEALGDPDLLIAYWLSRPGRYVDPQGQPIEPPAATAARPRTPILRGGREVAVVVHDATTLEPAELEREIGAAVRLAVENERLAAETLAQLGELRESRARVVESGDAERRRLERDLHDGAQQSLLTLAYQLRLACGAADSAGRRDLDGPLREAVDQALEALATLRELAHGIYPAVLVESGLASALLTLSGGAPLPVEIAELDRQRFPAGIETAAYLTVHETVQDAASRGASYAAVRVVRANGCLNIEVRDDAAVTAPRSLTVADRVGALGGRLEAQPSFIRAEFPCA